MGKVSIGDKKQSCKHFCGDYNFHKVMVSLHFLQYGKIEKTETKKKQTRLSDKKEVLDFCLEKQPVE
jgi:hypothetical protein